MIMSYLSVTVLLYSWRGDTVYALYCEKCPASRRFPLVGYLQRDTGSIWFYTLAAVVQWPASHPPPGNQTIGRPPYSTCLRRRCRDRRYRKNRFFFFADRKGVVEGKSV